MEVIFYLKENDNNTKYQFFFEKVSRVNDNARQVMWIVLKSNKFHTIISIGKGT